jgi:hypothetical protein
MMGLVARCKQCEFFCAKLYLITFECFTKLLTQLICSHVFHNENDLESENVEVVEVSEEPDEGFGLFPQFYCFGFRISCLKPLDPNVTVMKSTECSLQTCTAFGERHDIRVPARGEHLNRIT